MDMFEDPMPYRASLAALKDTADQSDHKKNQRKSERKAQATESFASAQPTQATKQHEESQPKQEQEESPTTTQEEKRGLREGIMFVLFFSQLGSWRILLFRCRALRACFRRGRSQLCIVGAIVQRDVGTTNHISAVTVHN